MLGIVLSMNCLGQGVVSGPWVSDVRDSHVTVLWTTDKAGQAYVELADGTKVWVCVGVEGKSLEGIACDDPALAGGGRCLDAGVAVKAHEP